MKETLGIALFALAAFFGLSEIFVAFALQAAPDRRFKAFLRGFAVLGALIVAVLVVAGIELIR